MSPPIFMEWMKKIGFVQSRGAARARVWAGAMAFPWPIREFRAWQSVTSHSNAALGRALASVATQHRSRAPFPLDSFPSRSRLRLPKQAVPPPPPARAPSTRTSRALTAHVSPQRHALQAALHVSEARLGDEWRVQGVPREGAKPDARLCVSEGGGGA